ncbi:MAG TPA: hypothetical protein VKW06_22520 [Candidatus Angelobacter sp.]|nr:hypothetical protein [Candidatus Angelobacter sp.]
MLRKFTSIPVLAILFLAVSCSDLPSGSADKSSSNTSSSASSATGPVTGKTAFWEMYKQAHAWAADLQPLHLESKTLAGMKNADGKAAMWSATFGSPRRKEARVFTYAVAAHAPDVYKGVTIGQPLPWNGPTRDAMPFDSADLTIDSDAAFQTALKQADAWVKEHPDKEFSCTLGNAERFKDPVWYVLWGDSKSGYAVFVDAKSGAIVNKK